MSGLAGLSSQEVSEQLHEIYTACTCHEPVPALQDLAEADDLISEMMKAAEVIWKNDGLYPGTVNNTVVKAMATKLWDGVESGYGLHLSDLDPQDSNAEVLRAIKDNVWQFSNAKNYQDLKSMAELIIGADGQIVSKSTFIQQSLRMNTMSLRHHLEAEYNLAITGGQMNAKWKDIQEDKELFPFLEFDAVLDEQTTSICRPLEGTVLPVDHPFWETYFPPNHYNCRSTARKKTYGPRGAQTPPSADIPKMFQTNIGKSNLVFPEGHPYFIDTPKDVLDKVKP